jgi:hypothetical protein
LPFFRQSAKKSPLLKDEQNKRDFLFFEVTATVQFSLLYIISNLLSIENAVILGEFP